MRDLVKTFKALSDANRIRILKMLEIRELCVCEITEVLQLATSTVSKHLTILRDAGFVVDSKDGKWVNFRLSPADGATLVHKLMPLLHEVLPDDETIRSDRELVINVDRNNMCTT